VVEREEELCFRVAFCPELQLVIVVGKISGFLNCLRTALYTEKRGILAFLSCMKRKKI
jgi:hypothetical protein